MPVGTSASRFTGQFNGLGHTVSDLTINCPTTNDVGLFGNSLGSVIGNVGFTNANITGDDRLGALIGRVDAGSIFSSYATGSVTGVDNVGGLVGELRSNNILTNNYAVGTVSANTNGGGLIGQTYGSASTINNNFWATDLSGQTTSAGGTGLISAQMQDISVYSDAGWDISETAGNAIWTIHDGSSLPALRAIAVNVSSLGDKTYDGTTYASTANSTINFTRYFAGVVDTTMPFDLTGSLTLTGSGASAVDAGTYSIGAAGYNSSTHLLDYQLSDNSITIDPRVLTVGLTVSNKTYDGTTTAVGSAVTFDNVVNGDTVTIDNTIDFAQANAGTGLGVSANITGLSGADAGNYSLGGVNTVSSTADINQATLKVTFPATRVQVRDLQNPEQLASYLEYSGFATGEGIEQLRIPTQVAVEKVGNTNFAVLTLGQSDNYRLVAPKSRFELRLVASLDEINKAVNGSTTY